jgi:hypothetical protein
MDVVEIVKLLVSALIGFLGGMQYTKFSYNKIHRVTQNNNDVKGDLVGGNKIGK